eukprot:TRINITY_DN7778_c0_g2_i1.p1 TRINITY_DN7778_c0_g2~~TRINITY_DN7778_c0_g2_i1.p1  ORF type:complete len:206 (+),score=6.01 TRINITY_DN7778_c0_g2_i1:181-798(+)
MESPFLLQFIKHQVSIYDFQPSQTKNHHHHHHHHLLTLHIIVIIRNVSELSTFYRNFCNVSKRPANFGEILLPYYRKKNAGPFFTFETFQNQESFPNESQDVSKNTKRFETSAKTFQNYEAFFFMKCSIPFFTFETFQNSEDVSKNTKRFKTSAKTFQNYEAFFFMKCSIPFFTFETFQNSEDVSKNTKRFKTSAKTFQNYEAFF